MHILIGYGDAPGTTGQYLEAALAAEHTTTFGGRGSPTRAGYAANLDLAALLATLPAPPELFLYVDSGNNPYAPQGLAHLPIPTAAYFMDAYPQGTAQRTPYLETLAPLFDILFVAHRTAISHYTALRGGAPVYWLPPCCDPAVHGDQQRERIYDVGFVGQVNASYPDRVQLLETLARKYRLNDYRRPYYREEMARIYSESKIVVNLSHTDQIIPMRFFEAPAAGAMLLTQHSAANGQSELLVEGKEYVSFATLDDALAKVAYYLAHDAERLAIAAAGQAAVLARHTYAHRAATILQSIVAPTQPAAVGEGDHARDNAGRPLSFTATSAARSSAPHRAPARSWPPSEIANTYARAYSQLRLVDCVLDQRGLTPAQQISYTIQALLRRFKHRG